MDMNVDYDTLCVIEDRLATISYSLNASAEQMQRSIRVSQDFLSGNQFEKAKRITEECTQLTERTARNLINAKEYINELLILLDEYGNCCYGE